MSRLRSYNDDDPVYIEWLTLDTQQSGVDRRAFGLWDVFGKVGGITHVFEIILAFIFTKYA